MVAAILTVLLAAATTVAVWLFLGYRRLRERYAGIVDIDAAIARARSEHETFSTRAANEAKQVQTDLETLRARYAASKETYDRLIKEIALLEENLEDISFGVYKPHFGFATSNEYKAKLTAVNERQKSMIRSEGAIAFGTTWTVSGSRREGERMQKQYAKLLLRAFNGESDAAIAKVSWDNVTRMEERIYKAFEAINKLGGV